jgi:cyclophilin family peptidyl-prolyl cis-trans isomerase
MKTIAVFFLSMFLLFVSNAQNKKGQIKENKKAAVGKTIAVIKTNMGNIELELFSKEAPKTVENFVTLAKKGYYKGIIFHRVIKGFMIQGGDPTGTGRGGESAWGSKFNDEIVPGLVFDKEGILAMANSGPNTNGSQFFITLAPQPHLNGGYTIFGKVIKGMDVVKAIGNVKTGQGDRPVKPVVMKEVLIEKR